MSGAQNSFLSFVSLLAHVRPLGNAELGNALFQVIKSLDILASIPLCVE